MSFLMKTNFSAYLHHVGVGEDGLALREPADGLEPVVGLDEEVHAVDADHAEEDEADGAHGQAGVLDGVGHGQDASPDVALQQVEDRITVAGKKYRNV